MITKTTKSFLILPVMVFLQILTVYASHALSAEAVRIGIFEIQKIIAEAKPVKQYRKRYDDTLTQKKAPLLQKEEEAKKLKEKIDKGDLKLDEKLKLEEQFAQKLRELKRQKEDLDQEVLQMEKWLKAQVFKDLNEIIAEIGKKDDYTIVIERNTGGIAYAKPAIDLTDKIIELYNQKK
ncbi:MAG: OmpH family outer membrane protein [Nitrospirae bacterium YQR-1]